MRIHVNQEDIRLGQQNCPSYCPIALAIKRVTKTPDFIEVNHGKVLFYDKDFGEKKFSVNLPPIAIDFYKLFDNGIYSGPFEFNLDLENKKS